MVRLDFDAVVVGGSLAGCATAIMLGRAGASVALVEKRPDPAAFKRTCSHFIQVSAVPTLEQLDLLEPMIEAGAVRTAMRAWTRWGWIEAPAGRAAEGVNLRRELLDPLIRDMATSTPGVELMAGWNATTLERHDGAVCGIAMRNRERAERTLRARLVVGADGRDSRIAALAGSKTKVSPHGRFAYGAYFEGPPPAPDNGSTIWMLDPQWAAAFPTDGGLVFYGAMPTKDRLAEFRHDPTKALVSFIADIPSAPPILASRCVSAVTGKIEMPNKVRAPISPGLALVGDAALAVDPLFGVGCGWALQSAEWLAESVAPALRGEGLLGDGLAAYRRRHRHELLGHATQINEQATGRRQNLGERMLFAAAARDPGLATTFDAFATRQIPPGRTLASMMPRAVVVNARHTLRSRGRHAVSPALGGALGE